MTSTTIESRDAASARARRFDIKLLTGSADKVLLPALPVAAIGVALNVWRPALLAVGGPGAVPRAIAIAMLVPGVVAWLWSVYLILTRVPRGELITNGPFRIVKHPLYTAVGLLVIPAAVILADSWLGIAIGAAVYAGVRLFAGEEEEKLAAAFGPAWDAYEKKVWLPWL